MSKAISKTALRELVAAAGEHCDHTAEDHEPGYCDYVVVSQSELSDLLEDAS